MSNTNEIELLKWLTWIFRLLLAGQIKMGLTKLFKPRIITAMTGDTCQMPGTYYAQRFPTTQKDFLKGDIFPPLETTPGIDETITWVYLPPGQFPPRE